MVTLNIVIFKIAFLSILAFLWAWMWTPVVHRLLIRYKLVKRIRDHASAPIYAALHKDKEGTPTMGGVLIWLTPLLFALFFAYCALLFEDTLIRQLNFLSRSQVFLPLGALVASALVGVVDDLLNIKGLGSFSGLRMRHRFLLYTLIACVGAWWFYFKLGWDTLHVPFFGDYAIGIWYIPFFIFVIVATAFSVNEADGLDGLAGGTLLAAFASFGAIAFTQGKYDLATFCAVIIGALLAFLWFNIYPAKFFMGDTGSMSLGVTLGIVAMLTNSALLLPVICFLYVLETGSVIIQKCSRKFFGRKLFLSTPFHHHLEARGWQEPTIVMRFWVIAGVTAVIGVIVVLVERGLY